MLLAKFGFFILSKEITIFACRFLASHPILRWQMDATQRFHSRCLQLLLVECRHCRSSRGSSYTTSIKFVPPYSLMEQTQCAQCGDHNLV